ncbi:MAG: hypothetical protein JWM68_769 [Verrucomicrobiales bacterium]|nr:hypothetical protein [Verrucomicrobiales bacterium]
MRSQKTLSVSSMHTEPIHSVSEALPQANERVIVITPEFRCLGYLDLQGLWHDFYDNSRVENVIGWAVV